MARLTHKEKGFVEDVAKGIPGVHAALNNYDTEDYHTAGVIAHENLKKPKIIEALEEALPEKLLNEVHREGLYATKPVFTPKGELVSEEADFMTRAKYLDMAYKRKGSYAAEKHFSVNVDVEVTPEVQEATKVLNDYFRQRHSTTGDGGTAGPLGTEA